MDGNGEVCSDMVFRTERYESIRFNVAVNIKAEVNEGNHAASYLGSLDGTQFYLLHNDLVVTNLKRSEFLKFRVQIQIFHWLLGWVERTNR
jgi:hypothetical protein